MPRRSAAEGGRDDDLAAEELDRPRIGAKDSGEDLAEGGLAGAVGADEAMALGGPHSQIDAAQGLGAAEALAHTADAEGGVSKAGLAGPRCR